MSTRKKASRKPAAKPVSAGIKPKIDQMLLTGHAFNGNSATHPDCTIADLIVLLFEAPNGQQVGTDPGVFIENVLRCAADDAELASCASQCGTRIADELERVMLRSNWRATVALELAKRMRAAAAAERSAS